jgi:hypothetical protein
MMGGKKRGKAGARACRSFAPPRLSYALSPSLSPGSTGGR